MNVYVAEFISLLIVASAIAIIRVKDLFAQVIMLSLYSALLAIFFAFLGAVDVSFTEAVVGTGVSTVFMMALIWRIDPSDVTQVSDSLKLCALAISACFFGLLLFLINDLPGFGDLTAPGHTHISPEYIAGSLDKMATPNVVTAVLADYRSFDTLIETAVVLTAALACLLVLGKKEQ